MSELMQLCTSADFSNPAWLGLLAGNSAGTASGQLVLLIDPHTKSLSIPV